MGTVTVAVDEALRPLLPARDRAAERRVLAADADATVGHLVPAGGFLCDVGLGALARRMRLLGLDTAWSPEDRSPGADDAELVAAAVAGRRVLLTQDRGLLMRRALPAGAWARGGSPDEQLA